MNFLEAILKDVKVELIEAAMDNFRDKGFFGQKWAQAKDDKRKGYELVKTGALRRSVKAKIAGNKILFSSSLPYASIHNLGGTIIRKGGKAVNMPQRQFLGAHGQVNDLVKRVVTRHIDILNKEFLSKLKKK